MRVFLVIVVLLAIIWWSFSRNKPANTTRSVTIDKDTTTYHGMLKKDSTTKKAFVMYVLGSVANLGEKWCQNIMYKGDDIKAKNAIEKAFDIVTTGSDKNYTRKGMFNPYKGQELASENKVFLDMYEALIFGSNSMDTNRIDLFSQEEKTKLLLAIHSIHNLLMSDDADMIKGRKELADSYDQAFSEEDSEQDEGKDAGAIFEKYYSKMRSIINQSPFKNETDRFELVYSMCVCADYIAAATKKNRYIIRDSVLSAIKRLCPDINENQLNDRMALYGEVIRGKALRGDWYQTVGDINDDANDAITKIVALLGDALYNPNCLEDYFSEERVILVRPITDEMSFLQNVITPLLASMREYADELA